MDDLSSPRSVDTVWPAGSFAELLTFHREQRGEQRAFTFLRDGETEELVLTYGELYQRAVVLARGLHGRGLAGERVLLLEANGADFIVLLCACLLAGVVAVPLNPPATRRLAERIQKVAADCRPAAVLRGNRGTGHEPIFCAGQQLPEIIADETHGFAAMTLPPVRTDAPAVLQYTSGSTGDPKGVVLTQNNLMTNCRLIAQAMATGADDVVVCWLPLLHDMGLIGSVIHVLYYGIHAIHMTPQAMIRRPRRWLEAVARYRGTMSGGPDFAWRLLTERYKPEDLADLDLSSWRVAYSGAEPVRSGTLDAVSVLLAPSGFKAEAFLPCYGLAEATLLVSGGPPPVALCLEMPNQPAGVAESCVQRYVGCGRPTPADSVRIVQSETKRSCPERTVGEIWVSGPHVAAGYWGRPEQSQAVFAARLEGDERTWLRTGDLGFLADGQLFITGRLKDLLIVNGRKHHPEDIEASIQDHVDECATGGCAVFQYDSHGCNHVVVAVEMARTPDGDDEMTALRRRIEAVVWCFHEIMVDEVVAVRAGLLSRTTSGKIRRHEVAERHRTGALGQRKVGS